MRSASAILIVALASGIPSAGEEVTDTTVCQIASHPLDYAGKMVRVRGRILIAAADRNGNPQYGAVAIWPRAIPSPLSKTQTSRKFDRYLAAKTGRKNRYEVTATLTGRLDTAATADGSVRCGGFGHLGIACSRLVIQSVADVVAKDAR